MLGRIVEHLRSALKLADSQCVEAIEPDAPPHIARGGDFFITVSPGDGMFIDGEQQIGNITEEWSVAVTAYSRIRLDPSDTDEKLLRDTARGLLEAKRLILKALVGQDLTDADDSTDTFLRQLLHAERCGRPRYDDKQNIGWLSIDFGVHYDWELT